MNHKQITHTSQDSEDKSKPNVNSKTSLLLQKSSNISNGKLELLIKR